MKLKDIKPNPNNPRVIKDDKFEKLKRRITQSKAFGKLNPIKVDIDMIIIAGNMRYRACQDLKIKEFPVEVLTMAIYNEIIQDRVDNNLDDADATYKDICNEFIIIDNVHAGVWEYDQLANDWDSEQLNEWGLDVWQAPEDVDLDEFFEEDTSEPANPTNKIVLEYSEEEYEKIVAKFDSMDGSKENIVWKLLGL